MPTRVESDSTPPPPRPIDVTKARVLLPVTLIVSAFVVSVGAGAAIEKMPDETDVERIALRVSDKAIHDAISAATTKHEHETESLRKAQAETARAVARQSISLARLEEYNRLQAIERVMGAPNSRNTLMRRNIIAGRDPLDGIVPVDPAQE